MAYPLVVNPVSAAVETVDQQLGPWLRQVDISVTHVTSWAMLATHSRSAAVEVVGRPHHWSLPVDINALFHHVFGIGDTVYLPSYPQLDRNNTTWPHAT